jgi:hypothetical protein
MRVGWLKPHIEELNILPHPYREDEYVRILRRLPPIFEDARPGREGRRAPATLVKRPSVERLRELFEYDAATGTLRWKIKPASNVKIGDIAGSVHAERRTHYRQVKIDDVLFKNHTVLWAMHHVAWPDFDIDHIDGDGLISDRRRRAIAHCQGAERSIQGAQSSSY